MEVGAQHAAPLLTDWLVLFEPPQESVEAAFAAVRIFAEVISASLGERRVQLDARLGGAREQRRLFGGLGLEEIGREREHPAGERDVGVDHAAARSPALHPFGEATGPP